jgi:hypothetical protein
MLEGNIRKYTEGEHREVQWKGIKGSTLEGNIRKYTEGEYKYAGVKYREVC